MRIRQAQLGEHYCRHLHFSESSGFPENLPRFEFCIVGVIEVNLIVMFCLVNTKSDPHLA